VLQQNVELAWQNVKASFNLYNEYTAQSKAYEKSFRAAEVKFKNGVITSVDYVIVKNNYDQAKVNLAAAKYLYLFRSRILDYYQGHLTW
jgi:outer membrane protein